MIPQGSQSCFANSALSVGPELHLKKKDKRKERAKSTPWGKTHALSTPQCDNRALPLLLMQVLRTKWTEPKFGCGQCLDG